MGWCSGTQVFDGVLGPVLKSKMSKKDKKTVIKVLIETLEEQDWDCQSDSAFYEDDLVEAEFRRIHPEWYEDEE